MPLRAQVAVADATLYYDKLYTYEVPARMEGHIFVGSIVAAPFGFGRARPRVGVVVELLQEGGEEEENGGGRGAKLKDLLDVAPAEAALSEELLAIVTYLKEATFCTWFEAVKAVLPYGAQYRLKHTENVWALEAQMRRHTETVYRLAEEADVSAGASAGTAGEEARRAESGNVAEARTGVEDGGDGKAGEQPGTGKTPVENKKPKAGRFTEKQKAVLVFLKDGPRAAAEIMEGCGVGRGVPEGLAAKGFLLQEERDKLPEESAGGYYAESFSAARALRREEEEHVLTKDGLCHPGHSHAPEAEDGREQDGLPRADSAQNRRAGAGEVSEGAGVSNKDVPHAGKSRFAKLSPAQQQVAAALKQRMEEEKPKPAMLYGVTGSGKTMVFMELVRTALGRGKTALVLVPEIGLTPQMIGQMKAAFGPDVAVQHSALSATERLLQWRQIRRGEAKVVVGTRSAVFAPMEKLGIVIIDEEQERSYQSENAPRYNAIEVAKRRAAHHGALLLLSSATPSIADYHLAKQGQYELLRLPQRYGELPLPEVRMVDMRADLYEGNTGAVSRELAEAMREAIAAGRQVILLLNRRGYHRVAVCRECGKAVKCSECSVPMVYHRGALRAASGGTGSTASPPAKTPALRRDFGHPNGWDDLPPVDFARGGGSGPEGAVNDGRSPAAAAAAGAPRQAGKARQAGEEQMGETPAARGGRLLCHYCGRSVQPAPNTCPECGGPLRYMGFGTQKLEEEIAQLLPGARVLRMDVDSTARKGAHEKMLAAFARGEYDILLGTQMVAKGLDFEKVSLVGVIGIDSLLFSQGYRAYENVFSLVTQVVGRSGRARSAEAAQGGGAGESAADGENAGAAKEPEGRAMIQTMDPENPVLTLAAKQDYDAFYNQEIAFRKMALYPPFCSICVVGFVAEDAANALSASRRFGVLLAGLAKARPTVPLRLLGPAPMHVAQVAGAYRYRLTLKCRADAGFRALVREALTLYNKEGWTKKATLYIDLHSDGGS